MSKNQSKAVLLQMQAKVRARALTKGTAEAIVKATLCKKQFEAKANLTITFILTDLKFTSRVRVGKTNTGK